MANLNGTAAAWWTKRPIDNDGIQVNTRKRQNVASDAPNTGVDKYRGIMATVPHIPYASKTPFQVSK